MGNSKTRIQIITYEEAEKKVIPKELSRLKIAFNQHEKNGYLYWDKFHSELFGSFLPYSLSEVIFKSLKSSSNNNGITFKEYLVFLVILTKGSYEDICKLIYNIYCNESGTGVDLIDLQRSADTNQTYRDEIRSARKFMNENQVISQENFMSWISQHPCFNQLSEWLLKDLCSNSNKTRETDKNSRLQLSDDSGPPDLYQLVAGITHLSEKEIMDLEKTYRRLLSKPPNKLDLERFTEITVAYIPHEIIPDLFKILDEDKDGILDIKELACGISACTRGPETERQKFCCKIFDTDKDGYLDIDDFSRMYEMCLKCHIPLTENDEWINNGSVKFRSLITSADLESGNKITIDELVIWLIENDFIDPLLLLLNEVFAIIFGLRPETKSEEIRLISSWIEREEQLLSNPSSAPASVALISAHWWNQWINENQVVNKLQIYPENQTPPISSTNVSSNNTNNHMQPPQLKALRNTNHSLSMNNLFSMPPKRTHHYDLLQRSRSSKDKLGAAYSGPAGTETGSITGRYTLKEDGFSTNHSSLQNSTSSIEPSPNRVYPIICSPSSIRYKILNYSSETPDPWVSCNNSNTSSISSNLVQSSTNNPPSTTSSNPVEIMNDHYKLQNNRFSTPINNMLLINNGSNNNHSSSKSQNFPNLTDISSNNESNWNIRSNMRLNLDYHIIPMSVWSCLLAWYKGGPSVHRPLFMVCDNVTNKPYLSLLFAQNSSSRNSNPHLLFYSKQHKQDIFVVVVEMILLNLFIAVHTTNNNNTTNSTTSDVLSASASLMPNIASTFIPYITSNTATSNSNIASLNQIQRQVKYRITISRNCHLTHLLTQFAQKLSLNLDEIRIWRMSTEEFTHNNNKGGSGSQGASFVLLDEDEGPDSDDGDAGQERTHKKPLFMFQFKDGDKVLLEQRNVDLTWPEELSQFAQIKSLHNRKASTKKGVTGLSNMGNSCFFNSAVQCISNCCPLTDYFQRGLHLSELNKNNNRGCNGLLATKYGELIKDIWSGSTSLIVPIKLKVSLQKYTRQFSDNQQHDAQELLCALLDGLHEDLNRVTMKPKYQELKDSDDRDDTEVANEAWRNHLTHNRSIIVDLFHGLLKSSVVCDSCSNKSVRFDAFSILSLPIPVETKELVDITVFPSDACVSLPSLVTVSIPISEPTVNSALDNLATKLNVPRRNICLAIVDLKTHKIQKFLDGNDRISKFKKYYAFHFEHDLNDKECDNSFVYFVFYNRKLILKTNYIVAQTRLIPEVFGEPIVKRVSRSKLRIVKQGGDDNNIVVGGGNCNIVTNRDLYNLLDPMFSKSLQISSQRNWSNKAGKNLENSLHSSLKLNHAIDCDQKTNFQSYVLSKIESSALKCSDCHWSKFCHGCIILPNDSAYDDAASTKEAHYFAIDWTIATLHLKQYSEVRSNYFDSIQPPSLTAPPIGYSSSKLSPTSFKQQSLDIFHCLEEFLAQESLGKDSPYQCCKCKQATSAHKKLDLWNLPPILIIHLKRFQYVNKRWQKSNRFVEFPSQYLDLSEYVVGNNNLNSSFAHSEPSELVNGDDNPSITNSSNNDHASRSTDSSLHTKYRLFAVNCHLGNLQMGHYITYARNRHTDKWFLFNDGICKEVPESEVMNTNAYLLFYQQIDFESDNLLDKIIEKATKLNQTNGATATINNALVTNDTVLPATEVAIDDETDEPSDGDFKKYCNIQ